MQEVVGSSPIISKNAEGLSVILSPIKCNCKFAKNRLPEYAPSRCEGKAARMPPAAYGGALRKAQEAPERRGRFKSDHLQKYNQIRSYKIKTIDEILLSLRNGRAVNLKVNEENNEIIELFEHNQIPRVQTV